jgi:hypothetical protein
VRRGSGSSGARHLVRSAGKERRDRRTCEQVRVTTTKLGKFQGGGSLERERFAVIVRMTSLRDAWWTWGDVFVGHEYEERPGGEARDAWFNGHGFCMASAWIWLKQVRKGMMMNGGSTSDDRLWEGRGKSAGCRWGESPFRWTHRVCPPSTRDALKLLSDEWEAVAPLRNAKPKRGLTPTRGQCARLML